MHDFFEWLFNSSDFTKRDHCGPGWVDDRWLRHLHQYSDLVIFSSYLVIALLMIRWIADSRVGSSVKMVKSHFVMLVLFCAIGHLIDSQMFTMPRYRMKGFWNLGTACISLLSATYVITVSRKFVSNSVVAFEDSRKLDLIFNHTKTGIAWISLDGKWMRVNNAVEVITGYLSSELEKMTYMDITHPSDLNIDNAFYERVKSGEIDTYTIDKRYIHKLGHVVWVRLTVMAHRNNGKFEYAISQIEDIDRQKSDEQKLRTRVNELEQAISISQEYTENTRLDSLLKKWGQEDRDG